MSIDVVKQAYEAYGEGDMPRFLGLLSEDIQWDHRGPPGVPFSKLYVGKAGVEEFFTTMDATQEFLEFVPKEFIGSGNRVVALGFHRYRVKETGKEWESEFAHAYTVEDGHVTSWRPIHDMTAEAMAYQP